SFLVSTRASAVETGGNSAGRSASGTHGARLGKPSPRRAESLSRPGDGAARRAEPPRNGPASQTRSACVAPLHVWVVWLPAPDTPPARARIVIDGGKVTRPWATRTPTTVGRLLRNATVSCPVESIVVGQPPPNDALSCQLSCTWP